MKTFLAVLFVVLAIITYVVLATGFGIYQEYPVIHYLLAIAGIMYLFVLLREKKTVLRILAFTFCAIMLAGFMWWTLLESSYGKYEDPGVLESVNLSSFDLNLRSSDNKQVLLSREIKKQKFTLLVFYRGVW